MGGGLLASDGKVVIDVLLDDEQVEKGIANIESDFTKLGGKGAKAFKGLGTAIKGVGVAAGAMMGVGVAAITGLVESTAELNGDLARLKANANAAGFSFGSIEDGFKKVAAVTGEMDSAVETVSNLMATDFSENQLSEALDYINGAAIKFSDTLKTEGIADGLQETFATGEAIGPFAELLERSGVNLDTFNAGLAQAAKTGSETDYVLQQMSQLGLGSVYEEYQKTNPELVSYNEASVNLQTALAGLGQTFMPLVTASKEFAITLINLVQGNTTLGEVIDGLVQKFAGLIEQFTGLDASVVVNAFEQIKTVVLDVATAIQNYFNQGLSNLQSTWQMHGETILATVQSAFDFVVSYIQEALNIIVPFVQEQLAIVQQFWTENGEQIVQAVTNFLQGAKAVFDFVLPAILFIVEYIWTAVKNVITGALDIIMGVVKTFSGLLTGDFSKMWEGVKQLFTGAIDLILGLMSLSFVGGIRTLVTNLAKTFINTIKTKWTTVVGLFRNSVNTISSTIGSWVSKLLVFIKNLATNFTSTVSNLRTTVVTRFKELSTQTINAVKDLPSKMLQIGKDIVNGLIKGIGDMFGDVKKKVESLAALIPEWAMDILGIHSPSRVMKQIGIWTGEGLAIGLEDSQSMVQKSMQDLGYLMLDVAEHYSFEQEKLQKQLGVDIAKVNAESADKITKIQESANTKRANIESKARKKKRSLTIAEKAEIAKIEKDSSNEITKIRQGAIEKNAKLESAATKNSIKALEDSNKEYLATVQSFIDDKKSLDQLNIIDEVKIWEQSIQLFDEGTTERIKAQQKYKAAVETVNKEITTINEQYQAQMLKIDEDYIREAERINKEYEDTFNNRVSSLLSFASTFEEFKVVLTRTGEELTTNLQSQVDGFKLWQEEFEKLSSRGVDGELLDELSNLGVKALPELVALNSMTDEQLTRYSELYREKSQLAREQAGKELEGMRKDTDKKLLDLRAVSDAQLSKLQTEWDLKIKNLVRATDTELSTLHQVGIDAGQGLLDGLASMESPLIDKAQAIADAIKATIQSALDIHSPSRWMRDFVAGNLAKGFDVGVDKNKSIFTDASARIGDLMKANIVNPLRGVSMDLGNIGTKSLNQIQNSSYTNQINNSRTMNNQITVGSKEDAAVYERLMRRMKFEFGL